MDPRLRTGGSSRGNQSAIELLARRLKQFLISQAAPSSLSTYVCARRLVDSAMSAMRKISPPRAMSGVGRSGTFVAALWTEIVGRRTVYPSIKYQYQSAVSRLDYPADPIRSDTFISSP
jgi:hypothetical protein